MNSPDDHIIVRYGGQSTRVNISSDSWAAPSRGKMNTIVWTELGLSETIVDETKPFLAEKLVKCAPSYITHVAVALRQLSRTIGTEAVSLRDLDLEDWLMLWLTIPERSLSVLRQMFEYAVDTEPLVPEQVMVAQTIATWVLPPPQRRVDAGVAAWVPDKGAFVSSERDLAYQAVYNAPDDLSDRELVGLVYLMILFETGTRGTQALSVRANALRAERDVHFLLIPEGKRQSGGPGQPYYVSEQVVHRIQSLAERPEIVRLQKTYDRLLVYPTEGLELTGEMSALQLLRMGASFFKGIISPRTNDQLKVSPRRTRHDCGTRLARDGASEREISAALGHKDRQSARDYIDATGKEITKVLAQVDDKTGRALSDLARVYKSGRVIGQAKEEIHIPGSRERTVVGHCACSGLSECHLPRFYACYGCVYFLKVNAAAVHRHSLEHVQRLKKSWHEAEALAQWLESTTLFDRLSESIELAIHQGSN